MANLRRAAALAVAVALATTGCGGDGGSDGADTTGPRTRAVEQLRDLGLTADQADCVVDELGAETVVEATDLNALTESQQYRDAATTCVDDG